MMSSLHVDFSGGLDPNGQVCVRVHALTVLAWSMYARMEFGLQGIEVGPVHKMHAGQSIWSQKQRIVALPKISLPRYPMRWS